MTNPADELSDPVASLDVEFHVDPQFLHRTLASQAFGIDERAGLAEAVDAVVHGIDSGDVADLRLAAIGNELPA